MKSKETCKYETEIVEETAFLIARKHFMTETKVVNGRLTFVFEDTPLLRENLADYNSGASLVSARALLDALDRCRDILWRWRRNGK